MNDSQIQSTIQALAAKYIRLEAKCYALSVCIQSLAERQGIPPDKAAAVIERQVDLAHQTILEKIENIDPATAATLDQRHSLGNLFD